MSLPRADYDPRRVCVNPCPNFTLGLGKNKRTVGVYLAGALVRPFLQAPSDSQMDSEPKTDRVSLFGSLSPRARLWVILRDGLDDNYLCGIACVCASWVYSSPLPIGLSSTLRSSPPTLNPHTKRNRCWYTSRSSTGSREFAPSSECLSSA